MAAILGFKQVGLQVQITTNADTRLVEREDLDMQYLSGSRVAAGVKGSYYPAVPITTVTFENVAATDLTDFNSKLSVLLGGGSAPGGSVTLTANQIAFGSAENTVSSSDKLTFVDDVLTFSPAAYNDEILRIVQAISYTGAAPYQTRMFGAINGDGTTYNTPVVSGFNMYGVFDPTRSGNYVSIESNYRPGDGTTKFMEYHYEITHPNGGSPIQSRLFSSTFIEGSLLSNSTNTWDFRQSTFNFMSVAGLSAYTSITDGQFTMTPNSLGNTAGLQIQVDGAGTQIINYGAGARPLLITAGWQYVNLPGLVAYPSLFYVTNDATFDKNATIWNGSLLRGYSDSGATLKYTLNASNGNMTTNGVIACDNITTKNIISSSVNGLYLAQPVNIWRNGGSTTRLNFNHDGATTNYAYIDLDAGSGEMKHWITGGGFFQTFYHNGSEVFRTMTGGLSTGKLRATATPEYANRTAALAGGLVAGDYYSLPIVADNKVICIV